MTDDTEEHAQASEETNACMLANVGFLNSAWRWSSSARRRLHPTPPNSAQSRLSDSGQTSYGG